MPAARRRDAWVGYGDVTADDGGHARDVHADGLWRWNVHTELWEKMDQHGVVLQVRWGLGKWRGEVDGRA